MNAGPREVRHRREVRRLFLGHDQRWQRHQPAKQLQCPRACRHHGDTGPVGPVAGPHLDPVVAERHELGDRGLEVGDRTRLLRRRPQRRHGVVRVHASGVFVEQHPAVEPHAGPPLLGGPPLEPGAGFPGRREGVGEPRQLGGRAVVHTTGRGQQRGAGPVLELVPEVQRTPRELHVDRLGVAEPEDPRCPVRRAAGVARLEPFQQHHVDTTGGELPRGRGPHRSPTDDHDVGIPVVHVLSPLRQLP